MAQYILDTDMITLLQKGNAAVTAHIKAHSATDVVTTAITIEEQLSGWSTFLRRATQPAEVELASIRLIQAVVHLAKLPLLPFTVAAIAEYDRLKAQKLNVKKNDLRIAAIALEAGAVVVSRNVRDFGGVPGLVVEDWSQPPPASPASAASAGPPPSLVAP